MQICYLELPISWGLIICYSQDQNSHCKNWNESPDKQTTFHKILSCCWVYAAVKIALIQPSPLCVLVRTRHMPLHHPCRLAGLSPSPMLFPGQQAVAREPESVCPWKTGLDCHPSVPIDYAPNEGNQGLFSVDKGHQHLAETLALLYNETRHLLQEIECAKGI